MKKLNGEHMYRKRWIILFFFLCGLFNFALSQTLHDTLKIAQKLRDQKKLSQASDILDAYIRDHPSDYYAIWIDAQTEFWRGKSSKSDKLYRQAIALAPSNDFLAIDYAKILVYSAKWTKADSILKSVEARGHEYSEDGYLRAQMDFLRGDYTGAEKRVDHALYLDGSNTRAIELYNEIMEIKSPWVLVDASLYDDDQPLQTFIQGIEGGIFLNPGIALSASMSSSQLNYNYNINNAQRYYSQWFHLREQSPLWETGIKTDIDAGIVKYPYQNRMGYTASIYLSKAFFHHLLIEALGEHKPYFSTLSSIDTIVSQYHLNIGAGWDDKNTWNGKVSCDYNLFNNNNDVYSYCGWLFSPPVKLTNLELRIGYSYNYSNSEKDQFRPTMTISEILASYSAIQQINGTYNPYFTPSFQRVNSAIISLSYSPSKKIKIIANATVGFYATTNSPFFYLNKNENGYYIAEGFFPDNYTPYNFNAAFIWQLKPKISVIVQYCAEHTYFFTSNYGVISIKKSFWNDTKKKR